MTEMNFPQMIVVHIRASCNSVPEMCSVEFQQRWLTLEFSSLAYTCNKGYIKNFESTGHCCRRDPNNLVQLWDG